VGGASTAAPRASATRASRLELRWTQSTGRPGYGYIHSALDDHSRLVYSEILGDETAATTTAWWARAVTWFRDQGITISAVLSDNGPNYRSRNWASLCADFNIKHRRTQPYRPQTNGKIERFHLTLKRPRFLAASF
jgi:transposase InsO family protein